MQILGISLTDWFAIIGFGGTLLSGLIFIFKRIVVQPILDRLSNLADSMDNFSAQLSESKQDRQTLHLRVNKVSGRVDRVETRLDYIEDDIKEIKNKTNQE
ncbi:hypothetical protein K5L52_000571 [Listeria monocytogenes]|uniref:hypothetical protein n=1 Tax=Listeria TaxID=1637 RepID=UPI0010EFB375|nr:MULTISPECIES: hypothetical protein [Listeria]EAC6755212.1 hypothetical protein [Listeria monocytogenes]EAC7891594.1 hypothetical protein [Listeria monocytogenes]EDN9859082.1 hypothetical protein [Listeria monocytogenes]EEO3726950.1 hypothetical protein [Listeria monocytogenes]EEO3758312.1 hypothetical protein [Listeria monocytogenes]